MAIIFELFIECETNEAADQQVAHFAGQSFLLPSGREAFWKSNIEKASAETWEVYVWSDQLDHWGICTLEDAVNATECGIRFYHRLLSAPDFLFARAGFNPCCPAAEISDFFETGSDGSRSCPFTCVLSDTLAEALGPLQSFKPFRPGYVWNEYRGENYWPLGGLDHRELQVLYKELLPS